MNFWVVSQVTYMPCVTQKQNAVRAGLADSHWDVTGTPVTGTCSVAGTYKVTRTMRLLGHQDKVTLPGNRFTGTCCGHVVLDILWICFGHVLDMC